MKNDLDELALSEHKRLKGKIEIKAKMNVTGKESLSIAYTPGVAAVCMEIAGDKRKVWDYTIKQNTVAIVSDGSAVLGLGDVGPEAAMPVMEGKAMLFKELAGVDGFPICLDTKDPDEIIRTVKNIAPVFGGINLEDIAAPKCFQIENQLQDLGIPVMHDDQHATAIVVYAAVFNAAKVVGKKFEDLEVVINGAGAAGIATAKMLGCAGMDKGAYRSVYNIVLCDSKGIISTDKKDLNEYKLEIARLTNKKNKKGGLAEAVKDADVFIGLSVANALTEEMVRSMNKNAIVFAMANPVPEIVPDIAKKAGAAVVGTGRSDFPNQINNVLAFPGVFRGALDAKALRITNGMKMAAALALADSTEPTKEKILPLTWEKGYVEKIASAVEKEAKKNNITRK